jgi:hypothetical protein
MMILGLFLVVFICFKHKKREVCDVMESFFSFKIRFEKKKKKNLSLLLKAFNGKKKCITKFMEKPTITFVFS